MIGELRWQSLAKGTASFLVPACRSSWHSDPQYQPEHFYQIFLRHYQYVSRYLPRSEHFVFAELGPGASIGSGVAALLAGADRYVALDVENLMDVTYNLETFDRLVALFRERRPPSNDGPFSGLFPFAKHHAFPENLASTLSWSLDPNRLAAIRADIKDQSGRFININIPWTPNSLPPSSVDWLMTHAVLEHIDKVDEAYCCFKSWLKPEGVMSHLVDFFSHGLTRRWNGHWAIGDLAWTLTQGRRYWLINRLPLSAHLARMAQHGFERIDTLLYPGQGGLNRKRFASRFRGISDLDAGTRMAFLVSRPTTEPAGSAAARRFE